MTRKFKLIKEYPGSTELGTIAENSRGYYISIPHGYIFAINHNPEKYPEFWEEVTGMDEKLFSIQDFKEVFTKSYYQSQWDKLILPKLKEKLNEIKTQK